MANTSNTHRNLVFSMIQLAASMLSSFVLTPLLFRTMGAEAAGYVSLGTTIVNVAQVFSIAITSMSTRYIVLSYHKDRQEANACFNSILGACLIITSLVAVIFTLIAVFIDNLINISPEYVGQMRLLIMFMGGTFCLSVLSCPFLSGQYYRQDLRCMYSFLALGQLARIAAPLLLFGTIGPSIWLPYFAGFSVESVAFVVFVLLNRKLLPGVVPNLRDARREIARTVLSGGVWSSVNKAGAILLSSASTYLSNIFVGKVETGFYSSFLQLQQVFASFTTATVGALVPRLIASYANDRLSVFYKRAAQYLKLLAVMLGVVCGVAIVYELSFFNLWLGVPVDEYKMAAVLLLLYLPFAYPTEVLNQTLIIQVRVKVPAIVTVGIGVLSLILSAIFCLWLHMGLSGIALAQVISQLLRAWVFLPVYSSQGDRVALRETYHGLLYGPLALAISLIISGLLSRVLPSVTGAMYFMVNCTICFVAALACAIPLFSREEKDLLIGVFKHRSDGNHND